MPDPRSLMMGSAVYLGALGGAALFLPEELVALVGLGPESAFPLQLASAGFLAVALLNWMGRGAIYGGIYGRPIVLANTMFGMVAAPTLAAGVLGRGLSPWLWPLAGLLALHALAFGRLMWSPPWTEGASGD